MTSRAYHLEELQIAQSPSDPRHLMPPVQERHRSILDVGCGAGQTLIAARLGPEVRAVGLDVDLDALILGRELNQDLGFVNGQAEVLPFADDAFDLVIARVALPWTVIPVALMELGRVLRPGGNAWLALHSGTRTVRRLAENLRACQFKQAAYRSYVLANGLAYHATGRLFSFSAAGPLESFQTASAIRRDLARAGFGKIEVTGHGHMVATAVKL